MGKHVMGSMIGLLFFPVAAHALDFSCRATGRHYWYEIEGNSQVDHGLFWLEDARIRVGGIGSREPFFSDRLTLVHDLTYLKYSAQRSSAKLSVVIDGNHVVKVWHEDAGAAAGAHAYGCE